MNINLKEIFEKYENEFLRFERVKNKRNNRADLNAFILLDSLVPGNADIVSGAEHDEIYLDISLDDLANVATEDQVLELIRCGVRIDSDTNGLTMFV